MQRTRSGLAIVDTLPHSMASIEVKKVRISSAEEFQERVCKLREPAILCGLDLGPSRELWSPQYLSEKCGRNLVKIHVSPRPQMDFINKTFAYK